MATRSRRRYDGGAGGGQISPPPLESGSDMANGFRLEIADDQEAMSRARGRRDDRGPARQAGPPAVRGERRHARRTPTTCWRPRAAPSPRRSRACASCASTSGAGCARTTPAAAGPRSGGSWPRRSPSEPEGTFAFCGDTQDPQAECARIRAILERQGPIDLAVLGLGVSGHLGFNEPAAELQPHAHVAELSAAVPRALDARVRARRALVLGLTMGMADLMRARRESLLVVSGAHKREVLARMIEAGSRRRCPPRSCGCTKDALCLCDRDAAGGLAGPGTSASIRWIDAGAPRWCENP